MQENKAPVRSTGCDCSQYQEELTLHNAHLARITKGPHAAVVPSLSRELKKNAIEVDSAKDRPTTFGRKGDNYLLLLYDMYGSTTVLHKINLLKLKLKVTGGSDYHFHCQNGKVTSQMILACLEHELLTQREIIIPQYC